MAGSLKETLSPSVLAKDGSWSDSSSFAKKVLNIVLLLENQALVALVGTNS
jgi:hypothetical protein